MNNAIELRNVSKDFQQGDDTIHALYPTDLSVTAGEFVGILGPSGSGKSTLLTIMGGLRAPTTGQVLIGGQKFSVLPEKHRAKVRFSRIGFILQSASLVPFLRLNSQFALQDWVKHEKVNQELRESLLTELGIEKLGNKYPADISGGERQRAAIATALYHDPDVILADEPTAALDTPRALEVAALLAKLTHERNKATVMVTHDERLFQHCDRVLRMVDGRVEELSSVA